MGVSAIVYWGFFQREYHQWSEVVRLWDGRTLAIEQFSSQRVYHGTHLLCGGGGWGGDHPWEGVTFAADGKTYHWEGAYVPIAVQLDPTGAYIVVFDRETDFSHLRFRLYRASSPTQWEEINPPQFPKHLAIQNTWLRENNGIGMGGKVQNEYEIVALMDPGDYWFRESLTGRLWSYLAEANFDYNAIPSEDFVRRFKKDWIQGAGHQRPQNAPAAERRR